MAKWSRSGCELDAAESIEGKKIEGESSPSQLDASFQQSADVKPAYRNLSFICRENTGVQDDLTRAVQLRLSYSARYQASLVPAFCPRVLAKPSPL